MMHHYGKHASDLSIPLQSLYLFYQEIIGLGSKQISFSLVYQYYSCTRRLIFNQVFEEKLAYASMPVKHYFTEWGG